VHRGYAVALSFHNTDWLQSVTFVKATKKPAEAGFLQNNPDFLSGASKAMVDHP